MQTRLQFKTVTHPGKLVRLTEKARYRDYGLDDAQIDRLAVLGDRILGAEFNVSGIREAEAIEHLHFLDSLSLLPLGMISAGAQVADVGSGAGLPALVLAIAVPARITAVEAQKKKCEFIRQTAALLQLDNVEVVWSRAETYGRAEGREAFDVCIARALASLPVVAEYSLPLLSTGGFMVAMGGEISNQERIQAEKALDILGAGPMQSTKLDPFPGARNRWLHAARKLRTTPAEYPRRVGVPAKRPLGR